MRHDVLPSLGAGLVAAVVTYLIDPTPTWWLVGLIVAVALLVNPCRSR